MSHNVPDSTAATPDPASELTDQQLTAIPLILRGLTDTATAAAIGVDRKTIYRWKLDVPAFAGELMIRRREIFESCIDRLCNLLRSALDVLESQIKEKYAPTSHRAARAILSLAGVGRAAAQIIKPQMQRLTTPGQRHSDAPDPSRDKFGTSGVPSGNGVRSAQNSSAASTGPTMTRAGARAIAKAIDSVNILGLNRGALPTIE